MDSAAATCAATAASPAISPKDILTYWFGGDLTENYHLRWFPPDKSPRQRIADQDIREKFSDLLHQFEADIEADKALINSWKKTPQTTLALIIVMDQFSRHIYRDIDADKIKKNTLYAGELCRELVAQGKDQMLFPEQLVFLLMPLRHLSPTMDQLKEILQIVDSRLKTNGEGCDMLLKFRRTTLRKLHEQRNLTWDGEEDILEHHEFPPPENAPILENKLCQTVAAFLREWLAKTKTSTVIISLSGGVDSMVLAFLCAYFRDHADHPLLKGVGPLKRVVAIHIDYANRPESKAEAEFVQGWCQRHSIDFNVRRIDEVTRGKTQRDEYERVSREIRYGFYKEVIRNIGESAGIMFGHHIGDLEENVISNFMKGGGLLELAGMFPVGAIEGVTIWRPMLSHPKTDIFDFSHTYGIPYFKDTTPLWSTRGKMRNQLMPILDDMYGKGFLDHLVSLSKESAQIKSLVDSEMFDPFIESVQKSPVAIWFDCAPHVHRPVFFWREALRRVCHGVLGTGLVKEKAIKEQLLTKIYKHAKREEERLAKGDADQIKNKKKGVKRSPKEECFIALKKDNKTFISGATTVIFRAAFFPRQPYFTDKTVLVGEGEEFSSDIGQEQSRVFTFGPWTAKLVRSKCQYGQSGEPVLLAEDSAVLTLGDVLSGKICYTIFEKARLEIRIDERPAAFKNIDKQMSNAIPIVSAVASPNKQNPGGKKPEWKIRIQLTFGESA
eukprot:TRINITY_DN4377_c0_g1_i1.p1 TRINITY_DN4377_c0_g1~~TRINITY_DN4377_c0_g1_i1.p1  ORF type:complete len:725 (-),score=269.54 TRINITY_DN4377_c0_g1_i1:55-2229(-)